MNDNRRIVKASEVLKSGSRVVFTGVITVEGQPLLSFAELDVLCQECGLIHEDHLSPDTTALVAEDTSSESSFAQLADLYGTPVVSAQDFSEWVTSGGLSHTYSSEATTGSTAVSHSSRDTSEPTDLPAHEDAQYEERYTAGLEDGKTEADEKALSGQASNGDDLDGDDLSSWDDTEEDPDEDDWEELDAAVTAYDRAINGEASGQRVWQVARADVQPTRKNNAQAVIFQGKDFTRDITDSYPFDIVSAKRAAITTSEEDLLLDLIDNPGALPVSKKTAKGQSQKMLWALVLCIVFLTLFGLNAERFLGNIFLVLFLAHVLLTGYHFFQMLIRLVRGAKRDIPKTRERLGLVLTTPLKQIPVVYTDENQLDYEEYSLVAQLCGFYNFLQGEGSPIPGNKWNEIVGETLLAVQFARRGDHGKALEVAETINLWLDEAAAAPLNPEVFPIRGIELTKVE